MSIKTLDDLLAAVPKLRTYRQLNTAQLRYLLDRVDGECTWCGHDVGRRQNWCSDHCVELFRLRCSPPHQVKFVVARDHGTCRLCGRDTIAAEQEFHRLWHHSTDRRAATKRQLMATLGHGRAGWREVDHILPVGDGGGLTGPENLRLLCGACHCEVSKGQQVRK